MKSLVERIMAFKGKEREYAWSRFKVKNLSFLSDDERISIQKEGTLFDEVLLLRRIIEKKAQGSYENFQLNFEIINKWGGINFEDNERNRRKILTLKKELEVSKLSSDTFKTISSLSKISSFIEPHKYVIYDSRVISALNWLLLTSTRESASLQFFPMPEGRNKEIKNFDINTILHIIYKDRDLYIPNEDAYFKYCTLIKNLSKEIYGENEYPCVLEMLLFKMADSEVLDEMKDRISISIV